MILTTGNNTALTVSSEAQQFLRADNSALARFASKFEQSNLSNDISGCSDSRAVATAVNAEIQALTPVLSELGADHGDTPTSSHYAALFCNV